MMLTGGSGLSDGFFYLYDYFTPEYNLLSFCYSMDLKDNDSLADSIAELIKDVRMKNVYLLGQSYGDSINADTVNVSTQVGSCTSLVNDRGGGSIVATNMALETNSIWIATRLFS